MQSTAEKKENPLSWLMRYFKESREELRKVSWPSKQETIKYSIMVIALCIILAAFFAGLDWMFNQGLEQLIFLTSS